MEDFHKKVLKSAAFLAKQVSLKPRIGYITGTGLGKSAAAVDAALALDYEEIPHFPVSTVQSHRGRLLLGRLQGRAIIVLQGRFHLYEGYDTDQVTFPIRVMQQLGVKTLIIANAAGGLNPDFSPGDIMLISDHINLTGENPLVGPNQEEWGPRFPDMSGAYDPALSSAVQNAGTPLQTGVYAGLKGPSLETPAEVHYLQTIGADAVGFSTVVEVIAAVHAGMRVLGLSVIANVHDPQNPAPAAVEEIIAVANSAAPKIDQLLGFVLAKEEF